MENRPYKEEQDLKMRSKTSPKNKKKKENPFQKQGICSDHLFLSGTVHLPDGVLYLFSI